MHESVPVSEARRELHRIVNIVEESHRAVTMTRDGEPVAVLVHPEDYEAMSEVCELYADPSFVNDLRSVEFT